MEKIRVDCPQKNCPTNTGHEPLYLAAENFTEKKIPLNIPAAFARCPRCQHFGKNFKNHIGTG